LIAIHPGVDVDQVSAATGWELQVAEEVAITGPPTIEELGILRDLIARTKKAHFR
jgi:glutaconate CoA-transferase subunit B